METIGANEIIQILTIAEGIMLGLFSVVISLGVYIYRENKKRADEFREYVYDRLEKQQEQIHEIELSDLNFSHRLEVMSEKIDRLLKMDPDIQEIKLWITSNGWGIDNVKRKD